MRFLEGKFGKINYRSLNEDLNIDMPCDFVVANTMFDDIKRLESLSENNYVFHDRVVRMKIELENTKISEIRESVGRVRLPIEVNVSHDYGNDINEIAYKAYTKDKRFHLLKDYNMEFASQVIDAYIDKCKEDGMVVVRTKNDDYTTGIIILKHNEDDSYDNVLGAVEPGVKGKLSAYKLYLSALDYIKKSGGKAYYGNVSSSNQASLNLHINLGAMAEVIIDEYIYRKGEKIC